MNEQGVGKLLDHLGASELAGDVVEAIVAAGVELAGPLAARVQDEACWQEGEVGARATVFLASLGQAEALEALLSSVDKAQAHRRVDLLERVGQLFRPLGAAASEALRARYLDAEQSPYVRGAALEGAGGAALEDSGARATLLRDCEALRTGEDAHCALLAAEVEASFVQSGFEEEARLLLEEGPLVDELMKLSFRGERFGVSWWREPLLGYFDPEEQRARAEDQRLSAEEREWKEGEPPPLFKTNAEELAALGDAELLSLLKRAGDGLPPCAIAELSARGERLAPGLTALVEDEELWAIEGRESWAPVHASFFLAELGGDALGPTLLKALGRAEKHRVGYVIGSAETLFARVSAAGCAEGLRAFTMDPEGSYPLRLSALSARASLCLRDEAALEDFLADCSELSKQEDEALVMGGQTWLRYFNAWGHEAEVTSALVIEGGTFADAAGAHEWLEGAEEPDEARAYLLRPPLDFYKEEERRERWSEEGCGCGDASCEEEDHGHESEPEAEGPWASEPEEVSAPFVRQEVKVGRNEACPCGSGRKYKKCCLS